MVTTMGNNGPVHHHVGYFCFRVLTCNALHLQHFLNTSHPSGGLVSMVSDIKELN